MKGDILKIPSCDELVMIDFHIHSYFSDGDQSPQEILNIAARRKLSAVAITDHCDSSGQFMYLRDVSTPRPLREYIDGVRNLPSNRAIQVFLGLELSNFSNSNTFPAEFSELDFLLVETYPIKPLKNPFNPIEKAQQLKKVYSYPIGLAHPSLQDIERNIELIDQYGLFIELNFDKLISPPTEKDHIFKRTAELLNSTSKVQISIGSDAHIIFLIGAVKPIWEFVVQHDFLKRLILISK
jgi:histidinol phosphatase-like PHP family hydrolase